MKQLVAEEQIVERDRTWYIFDSQARAFPVIKGSLILAIASRLTFDGLPDLRCRSMQAW